MKPKIDTKAKNHEHTQWSSDRVILAPVRVGSRDYAVLLDRVAFALYPYLTSSASHDLIADPVGDSNSSSLHLPKTKTVGSSPSGEVNTDARTKESLPAA